MPGYRIARIPLFIKYGFFFDLLILLLLAKPLLREVSLLFWLTETQIGQSEGCDYWYFRFNGTLR
jgi:hypothetical protein